MKTMKTVRIYHTADLSLGRDLSRSVEDFAALAPQAGYQHVFVYGEPDDMSDPDILDRAFMQFNVGQDWLALEYRRRGNRSLSVGDLVIIDGKGYVCGPAGWLENSHQGLDTAVTP